MTKLLMSDSWPLLFTTVLTLYGCHGGNSKRSEDNKNNAGQSVSITAEAAKKMLALTCPTPYLPQEKEPEQTEGASDEPAGGLTAKEIMAVIKANLTQIRTCYETSLKRIPDLEGRLRLRFVVGVEGKVDEICAYDDATINDADLWTCVVDGMKAWEYPKPRGSQSVTINYPFVFNPIEDETTTETPAANGLELWSEPRR